MKHIKKRIKPIKSTKAELSTPPVLISRDMLLGNVIKYNPGTIGIMMNHGINCFACHISNKHTLEHAASFDNVDVGKLMMELNQKSSTWR